MFATIQRILVPTDFSEPAHEAQKYAMAFAEKFGAELHLLHIVAPLPLPSTYAGQVSYLPDVDMACLLESGKAQLAKEVDHDWFRNHPTVQAVELGFAADEIVRYAKHHKIDLIVMGTHGRTGLSHLILGSVAEKIVRVSECPVLTVHPGTSQTVHEESESTESRVESV